MKVLVLGIILSFGIQISFAVADDPTDGCAGGCGVKMRGTPGEELKDIKKLAMSSEDKELRKLGTRICAMYSGPGNKITQNVKEQILTYIKKHEGIANPSVPQIIKFLNRNKNKILCENGTKSYMMVAFDNSAHEQLFRKLFVNDFFKKDKTVHVDINAVAPAGANGEAMTVLDYIEQQLADPTNSDGYKKEVRSLRNMFVKYFGAKKFSELPDVERSQYRLRLATK